MHGYPRFRELGSYRLRVTYALLVILGLQEIGFVALAVVGPAGTLRPRLRLAVLVLWLAGGVWLALVYLR